MTTLLHAVAHAAVDWNLESRAVCDDPLREAFCVALATAPDGTTRHIPAFWKGERNWCVRISEALPGRYTLRTSSEDAGLDGQEALLEVAPTEPGETNPILRHGPLRMSDDGTRLVRHDGTPFLWFGDTWWMLMSGRVSWPEGFCKLTANRAAHGINLAQVVVGFPPDSTPFTDHAEDNEGGPPWLPGFAQINPCYFEWVDLRLRHLIASGITPCILGGWGYQLQFMSEAKMTAHWRYLVARYAAWLVVWMLAGETAMRYYLSSRPAAEDEAQLRSAWTRVAQEVRRVDPYHRPLTTHPRRASWDDIDAAAQLDFHTVQTGHLPTALQAGIDTIALAAQHVPGKLVINAEPPYENHGGTNGPDIQRYAFWSAMLGGHGGYTYGAAGIFQANDPDRPSPRRPDGGVFDRHTWLDAMGFAGIAQLGSGMELLRSLPFERFVDQHQRVTFPLRWGADAYRPAMRAFAAGIPGECLLIYLPLRWYHWDGPTVLGIPHDERHQVTYIDPESFHTQDAGVATPDSEGSWTGPIVPYLHDWLILLRKA